MIEKVKKYFDGTWVRILRLNEEYKTENRAVKNIKIVALLLHGWMGCGNDLIDLGLKLAGAGLEVVIPDLSFHGMSIENTCVSITEQAEYLIKIVTDNFSESNSLVLCGYSMGGRIIHEIVKICDSKARNSSLVISSVIFMSSSLPPESESQRELIYSKEEYRKESLKEIVSGDKYERWLRSKWYSSAMWGSLESHPNYNMLISRKVSCFSEKQRDAWANAITALGTSKMEKILEDPQLSVLYLYGSLDSKYKNMALRYENAFGNLVSEEVKESGHNVLFEKKDVVSSSILKFLLQHNTMRQTLFLSIKNLQVKKYTMKLRRKMKIKGEILEKRDGLVLNIELDSGCKGVGDIVPLPGWHQESVEDAEKYLVQKMSELRKVRIRPYNYLPDNRLDILIREMPKAASFGLEMALMQALSKSLGLGITDYMRKVDCEGKKELLQTTNKVPGSTASNNQSFVQVCGVLPREIYGKAEDWTKRMTNLVKDSDALTLKLKVGASENVYDDIEFVKKAVRIASEEGKTIRLDANQAWSIVQWLCFEKELGDDWSKIEFIEEPVDSKRSLLELSNRRSISASSKLALDESLLDLSFDELDTLLKSGNFCAMVIKPFMYRSITKILELCNRAESHKMKIVFSSTFESGIGLSWISLLSVYNHEKTKINTTHGLGTFKHLQNDVSEPSFEKLCVTSKEDGIYIDSKKCVEYLESFFGE